jgi:hypothetical protein
LIGLCTTVMLATFIQTGFFMAELGQVGFILAQKFQWDDESKILNINILSTIGLIGFAIGSLTST